MRLGTCVALEIAVGAGMALAVGTVATWGLGQVSLEFGREAHASESRQATARLLLRDADPPRLIDRREPIPSRPGQGAFRGIPDEDLLAPLRGRAVTSVKFNRGGSSLSMRLDFEGGGRAAFKPEQMNLQTIPRKEVAAYRVSRLLGLDTVAPAIGVRLPIAELERALRPDARGMWPRFLAEVRRDGDFVEGELSYWIPEIRDATLAGVRLDSTEGIVSWRQLLAVGAAIPPAQRGLLAQVSDLVLFDVVVNNPDRWSGNNTKSSPDGEVLYVMDNAMAFAPDRLGHSKVWTYFERAQTFSRTRVERLRALDDGGMRAALAWDAEPWGALLTDAEIAGVLARRDAVLATIDRLIAQHGEASVLVFP